VGVCVVLATVATSAAQASVEESGTVKLRAHAPNVTGYGGPAHTKGTLPPGELYVAEVSGAVSYWATKQFRHPSAPWNTVCGDPLPSSLGPLGIDAEFVFARPWFGPCPTLPMHWNNFELSTGSSYSHPQPIGGPFTQPTPEHKYSYALVGQGGKATFRLRDMPNGHPATADNHGFLTIHVRRAVASDCTSYTLFDEPTEAACLAAIKP
jgi:hypothetical protein